MRTKTLQRECILKRRKERQKGKHPSSQEKLKQHELWIDTIAQRRTRSSLHERRSEDRTESKRAGRGGRVAGESPASEEKEKQPTFDPRARRLGLGAKYVPHKRVVLEKVAKG